MPESEPLNHVINVVVAGLGGQGVIKASDILADAVFRAGFDVKKAEVHGMSQRGGSVNSDVRFGPRVFSPMIPDGEADFLVVLAEDQVETNRNRLRANGVLIDPSAIGAAALSNPRTLNVALLGLLSTRLPVEETHWIEALRANLPEKILEINMKAFQAGRTVTR
ncbi:MAG TPA: indolepyruvate oxidoreductase subunit beta [bacterium]|nr:indolepyruvate oxidoreductase subunit beta [Candidatus Omnitrophota bacterium]HOJ61648.1 indolepyruvate oxidoreductase subunit beta [bacterium]HOL96279.1 indolepyruvate oxidoreductase subunit beta [bacterium]HPP01710.1 indolepyruvate oxidoreductase subunit beta [bacterium]